MAEIPKITEERKIFPGIPCPAKINLFLYVTGKRPDAYHELLTLMCPVSLCDTLFLQFGKSGIRVECSHPEVPEDSGNIAWHAAELFFQRAKLPAGVHIRIQKKIPVAAGLGGGSSNAAGVLLGLNRYYRMPFSPAELSEMALHLGADVPFFLRQRPALARGIGEELEILDNLPFFSVLLISFDFAVSTAYVYKNLNLGLTKGQKIINDTLFKEYICDVLPYMHNDLETVTAADYPVIHEAKETLKGLGADGALMSGSGPTVFGLFRKSGKARTAYDYFYKKRHAYRPYLAELLI